jgi:hypothetical protein
MKTIALEPFHQLSMAVLLNIQGKCAGLRAKSAHFSGHLPPQSSNEFLTAQLIMQVPNTSSGKKQ